MKRFVVALIVIIASTSVEAQRKGSGMQMMKPGKGTVCYASSKDVFTTINPPAEFLKNREKNNGARTKSANIIVTYEDFTPDAQAAFQEAVDIWESLLTTSVTIRIHAQWSELAPGVLGSAGPGTYVTNFEGAPKQNVWYPIALAEKIAGKEINDTNEPDIFAQFNSANENWHLGLTGSDPPAGTYDLVTIVLHEIGHGLGITHGYSVEGSLGVIPDYLSGLPVVYETSIQNGAGKNLVNDFTPPSADLKTFITSRNLLYASPLVRAVNSNFNASIYAPSSYSPGSSIAHLDDDAYPAGSINSLMTPFINSAERNLDPGPLAKNILADMGWIVTTIKHTRLKNTESSTGPYHVVAKVVSDNGYDANLVTLNYKTTGSVISLPMTATANANEFAADLPVGSSQYNYFISVKSNDNRIFTNPGTVIDPGSAPVQGFYVFETGPDTKPPVINHIPKEFITTKDDLDVLAIVSDNIGVDNVKIEWKINGASQPSQAMALVPNTDSTYAVVINFATPLEVDDKIEYRIRAEDSSIAGNVAYKPSSTTYFTVNVTGLGETQDSYSNNFDNLSAADFFGNGFNVSKPTGFNNGAIHSEHPYAAGGAAGATLQFIYNLKTPIRIAEKESVLKFDEIVLVEPGEDGAAWPSEDFYDYVVVEGSVDGGDTWIAVADGYDSRYNSEWLSLWNGSIDGNNATAVGAPSMYRSHSFNLLDKFDPGDEVAFRFRLYSDPFSFGWGWSIDNLKIQIDDAPPVIKHQHMDYVLEGKPVITLEATVEDNSGIEEFFFDYNINGGTTTTSNALSVVTNGIASTKIILDDLTLKGGDEVQYRFRSKDIFGNSASFPSTGFIKVAVISFNTSLDQLVTDFATASADITGNFFGVAQPANFNSPGMSSNHPYNAGMGIDGNSEFTWMTRKPIKVSATNPRIYFEDVAVVEYGAKDYVTIEGSKDGITWETLLAPYDANFLAQWRLVFDNNGSAIAGMMQNHTVTITESGKFKTGDVILVRFRLHSNDTKTGWGWHVDNLSIQGPITGLEPSTTSGVFDAWPNPVRNGSLHLTMALPRSSEVSVEIFTTQGQLLSNDRFSAPSGDFQRDYEVNNWPDGFYLVRVSSDFGTTVKKLIKLR